MSSAVFERTAIDISSEKNELKLRANGSVVKFDGFLNIYSEFKVKSDEQIKKDENEEDEDEVTLPAISKGMKIESVSPTETQHFTLPPPRYSEASLVKKLEELGIGRPSTYASIISVLNLSRIHI